jgi:hypothetical protein
MLESMRRRRGGGEEEGSASSYTLRLCIILSIGDFCWQSLLRLTMAQIYASERRKPRRLVFNSNVSSQLILSESVEICQES